MTSRILIVDDDRLIRVILTDTLRGVGHITQEAADGTSAKKQCREFKPDLILLDKELPDTNGLDLLRDFRESKDQAETPIIMITSSDAEQDIVQALLLGAQDYIVKPFSAAVVLARINTVLEARFARLSLELSNERYDLAASAGQCGLWEWNLIDDKVVSTMSLVRLLGAKSPLPTNFSEWIGLIHDEDRDAARLAITDYVEERRDRLDTEFRIPSPGDSERWFLCRGRVVQDPTGKPTRLLGALADISARKSAEIALRHSLRSLTEAREQLREKARLLVRSNNALQEAARIDPLTNIPNRRAFQERLSAEYSRSIRHQRQFASVMVDIDNFKSINDRLGHAAGDAVLVEVANRLNQKRRESDFLCRFGGEEFCVLLPETDERAAAMWAERAREALSEHSITAEGASLRVSGSFGVAALQPHHQRPDQLVDDADQALLLAKKTGKNRVLTSTMVNGRSEDDLAAKEALSRVEVADLMRPCSHLVLDNHTIHQVIGDLDQHGLASAPVVNERGILVGVISEKDLIGVPISRRAWNRPVRELISGRAITFEPETPVTEAIRFLQRAPIRMIVVARDNRPMGYVTRSDLVAWARTHVFSREDHAMFELSPEPVGAAGPA